MSTDSPSPSPTSTTADAIEDSFLPRRTPHVPAKFDTRHCISPSKISSIDSNKFMLEEDRQEDPPGDGTDDALGATITGPNINDTSTTTMVESGRDCLHTSPKPTQSTDRNDSDSSPLQHPSSDDGDERHQNQTFLEEGEMRQKLMDMESSFLPEPSTIQIPTADENAGADDTYLLGISPGNVERPMEAHNDAEISFVLTDGGRNSTHSGETEHVSQTPCTEKREESTIDLDTTLDISMKQDEGNTTLLEIAASSPAAAAAARTAQRNSSAPTNDSSKTDQPHQDQLRDRSPSPDPKGELPPMSLTVRQSSQSLSPGRLPLFQDNAGGDGGATSRPGSNTNRRASRPKYLITRSSSHRLSSSSITSSTTETTNSEATLGADYALQSGGAAPGDRSSSQNRGHNDLVRSVSLGSLASGISGYSDENVLEKRNATGLADGGGGLQTLDEEDDSSHSRPGTSRQKPTANDSAPMTPKGQPPQNSNMPTDTAIADRLKDIQIPSVFVRQYGEDLGDRGMSSGKRTGAPTPGFTRSGRTMTLKEQSSTIDRLSKENFDLKMRIHFLNEALSKRSEEGMKEVVSENVELKSDKLKLQKENQHLKRRLRDLEKQLKDKESDKGSMINNDPDASEDEDRDVGQYEEEIMFLRERLDAYELEIDNLRAKSIARESEKRRLAELVKSLSEGRAKGSDVGAREERDMWKDMLEAETAAREQAEEENKKLRDEILRLKGETSSGPIGSRSMMGSVLSYSAISDRDAHRNATIGSSASGTLVELELLKQENAELRKEVSAQTSMLTSRNREKERLYQEIEELKLGQRRDGGRSIAGDSIFDRSASRANIRPSSRGSDGTRTSRTSDIEREGWEIRNGQLRDQVSTLKLENQTIRAQLEKSSRELEARDKAYQADVDQAEEEIRNLQQELNQTLQVAEEREIAFQDLRADAQEEIDALADELDQKVEEFQRMEELLRDQDENLKALQAEVRSASEGIFRLEEDAQSNLEKYKAVQQELEESNREIESLEKGLFEANAKVQRLTVQIESGENEIAFLREEQDGDKIKITDLESELKTCQVSLQNERDKTRELEQRLAEERHQREVVGTREKQEVQRIMNELNREASAAKEEIRKLKKSLSAQEIETATWKERLMDLESNLRETLGDLDGSRSSLISNITKLQKELESTALELESARTKLDEKESLLRNRDALLESHGLESRKLAELLERERQARRADKQSFEQALKSHHQASRTITQTNSRISELEGARSQDRKRYSTLEQQYKEQLSERNSMLLTIWKRLSTMCGPDWVHSNSLINGNLPSQEVIGNILFWPGFSRNLLLAVKTVESVISGFKNRIKSVERDLTKQYQSLEHTFNLRVKKLDRLEEAARNIRAQQHSRGSSNSSPEVAKLRGENRLLKAELNLVHSHSRSRNSPTAAVSGEAGRRSPRSPVPNLTINTTLDAERSSLVRHNSASMVEKSTNHPSQSTRSERGGLSRTSTHIPQPTHFSSSTTLASNGDSLTPNLRRGNETNDQKWAHRLHELEKRLKAEREARLLDRSGARKRLEERDAENQRLRAQLEKERVRKGALTATSSDGSNHGSRSPTKNAARGKAGAETGNGHTSEGESTEESSSEGEGIYVDIEV